MIRALTVIKMIAAFQATKAGRPLARYRILPSAGPGLPWCTHRPGRTERPLPTYADPFGHRRPGLVFTQPWRIQGGAAAVFIRRRDASVATFHGDAGGEDEISLDTPAGALAQ